MATVARPSELMRVVRYYQAGIVNTLFGVGLFTLLFWIGLNVYLAQFVAHFCGMAFNYLTYSRYAFGDRAGSKPRFVASYIVNYALGLASLWAASQIIASAYLAFVASFLFVTIVNYFILKRFVFATTNDA